MTLNEAFHTLALKYQEGFNCLHWALLRGHEFKNAACIIKAKLQQCRLTAELIDDLSGAVVVAYETMITVDGTARSTL